MSLFGCPICEQDYSRFIDIDLYCRDHAIEEMRIRLEQETLILVKRYGARAVIEAVTRHIEAGDDPGRG